MVDKKVGFDVLKDNDLLFNVVKEVQKRGVVGEEDNIICLIMKVMLRSVLNSKPVSSNLVVADKSGAGKDNIVSAVCKTLLNDCDYECYTHITEKVLAYYDASWNGKVLHIKDPPFDLLNGSVFKTVAEGGSKALILGSDKKVNEIIVDGKPVILVTSMNVNLGDEAIRRWDSCQLDTTKKLTRVIVKYKLNYRNLNDGFNIDLCNGLTNGLKSYNVVVPFADKLVDEFGSTMEVRTSVDKLIDFISACAVFYQYQRKKDKFGNIVADWFDYEVGVFVFRHLNSVVGVPLSRDELDLLELLSVSSEGLLVRDIISGFKRSKDWIYRRLNKLKRIGLVDIDFYRDNVSNKDIARYSVSDEFNFRISFNKGMPVRSDKFEEVKLLFNKLDDCRSEIGLNSLFDSWLS